MVVNGEITNQIPQSIYCKNFKGQETISTGPVATKYSRPMVSESMEESRLENVPVEIQLIILHHLSDFASLYALVYASPRYHNAYLTAQRSVLSQVFFEAVKTAEAQPCLSSTKMMANKLGIS